MTLRSMLLKGLAAVVLALATFTPATAAPVAAPAPGVIQINYHRPDGVYDKWGAHLWKNPNMPLDGVEWPNPMKPSAMTDFGAQWEKPAKEFETGHGAKCRVNYIIHQGDIKEQGGKDMGFDGKAHQQIFVYQNDSTIFYRLDEVKAAHPDVK